MASNQMEQLLLESDDDGSGSSDSENEVMATSTTQPTTSQVAPSPSTAGVVQPQHSTTTPNNNNIGSTTTTTTTAFNNNNQSSNNNNSVTDDLSPIPIPVANAPTQFGTAGSSGVSSAASGEDQNTTAKLKSLYSSRNNNRMATASSGDQHVVTANVTVNTGNNNNAYPPMSSQQHSQPQQQQHHHQHHQQQQTVSYNNPSPYVAPLQGQPQLNPPIQQQHNNNNNMMSNQQRRNALPMSTLATSQPSTSSTVPRSNIIHHQSMNQYQPTHQQQQQQPQRQQQRVQHQLHQHHVSSSSNQHHNRLPGSSSSTTGSSHFQTSNPNNRISKAPPPSSTTTTTSSSQQQESKVRKEQFLMFTKVLMKYLEARDQTMHEKAKQVIKDCAKKNKEGVEGYSSLSVSMQSHLRATVGEGYWKKAEDYLCQYLLDSYKKKRMDHNEAFRRAKSVSAKAASSLTNNTPAHGLSSTGTGTRINSTLPSTTAPSAHQKSILKTATSTKKKSTKKRTKTSDGTLVNNNPDASMTPGAPSSKKIKKTPSQRKSETTNRPPSRGGGSRSPSSAAHLTGGSQSLSSINNKKKVVAGSLVTLDPLREYAELMEMVDHVVDYDVTLCSLIFNDKKKLLSAANDMAKISNEQKKLLYDSWTLNNRTTSGTSIKTSTDSSAKKDDANDNNNGDTDDSESIPVHLKGWSSRNIVSARAAWAKLRLKEEDNEKMIFVLPGQQQDNVSSKYSWFNEEKAENDQALALISEATQQYMKTVLQAAVSTARQRLNIDGIRIWHKQITTSLVNNNNNSSSSTPKLIMDDDQKKQLGIQKEQPLHLRLGCDIKRQYAMAEGNAAKTCQRMEEALKRKEHSDTSMKSTLEDYATLCQASSMAELSKIPLLKNAASKADHNAKRCFEIYGGKYSSDPPLGRVPKKVRIMMSDIQSSVTDPRIRRRRLF